MSLIKKIQSVIKNPFKVFCYFSQFGCFDFLDDHSYLKFYYKGAIGEVLDLSNPKSFNAKLQWLKLYDKNDIYPILVDKFEVRKYISSRIGDEYLVPLIGVWNSPNNIDFHLLPNKFVLKCTHDSGGIFVCRDKETLNTEHTIKLFDKLLNRKFYLVSREWPYKYVKPRIIAETYLENDFSDTLIDYKVMCFNGKAKCIFTCTERDSNDGMKITFFDLEWNKLPIKRHYSVSSQPIKKPENLNLMIELSEILSNDLIFSRIDFYEINSKLFVGEITLYPGAGMEEFTPSSWDYTLGSWLELPKNLLGDVL